MNKKIQPTRRLSVYERKCSDSRTLKALLVSLALVGMLTMGGAIAFLTDSANEIVNTFTPSSVTTAVVEDIKETKNVKKDVKIANTGNTEAYIRAAVVVTWQDESGNVYGQLPVVGVDFEIEFNTTAQDNPDGIWTKAADGFYYWSNPVEDGGLTGILISECKLKEGASAPEGAYYLNVEILGSGIQAKGDGSDGKAPVDSWDNVKVNVTRNDDGTLTVENINAGA